MSSKTVLSNSIKLGYYADVATMPLHWIYDQKVIAEKVPTGESPAFYSTPSCPFYKYPFGVASPYGDEAYPLLRSLASAGKFDKEAMFLSYFEFFKDYPLVGAKGYEGRLNHVTKEFVANREKGNAWEECAIEDSQGFSIAKVPALVARYAGSSELTKVIESHVNIMQKSALSVSCSVLLSKILERIILKDETVVQVMTFLLEKDSSLDSTGKEILKFMLSEDSILQWTNLATVISSVPLSPTDPYQAMKINGILLSKVITAGNVLAALDSAFPPEDEEFMKKVKESYSYFLSKSSCPTYSIQQICTSFGQSCSLPGALLIPLYLSKTVDVFEEAVNINILVGGDNCSRAMVLGSLYAKKSVVPESWKSKVKPELLAEIDSFADKIAQDNNNV